MTDRITIDIGILQGIFGDLHKLQQRLGGITGGVAAIDNAAAKSFGGMQGSVNSAAGAVGALDDRFDASMRNIVGDIMAPLARTQELEAKLRALGGRMNTAKSVGKVRRLKQEINATQKELDGVNPSRMEQRVGGAISRMRSVVTGMAMSLAGAFAVGGVAAFGKGLLDAASNAQMYESSLGVILKNKGHVDSLMAQVKTFAAQTPFELTEVQEASKGFAAAGFTVDEIIPKLRTIGQTASALGQPFDEIASFYRKVKSSGIVQAEELNQMGDRGIPLIQKLAEVMGVTEAQVRALASEGQVGFKEMEVAFERMGGVGGDFDGIFGAAMGSLAGKMSTLSDAWGSLRVELGTALAPTFSAGIEIASSALDGLKNGFQWVMSNGETILGVLEGFAFVAGIYAIQLIANNRAFVVNLALKKAAAVADGVMAMWTALTTGSVTAATTAQWNWNAALLANPIGLVVAGIAALVAAVVYAWNNFEGFRAFLYGLWESVKVVFQGIWEVIKTTFSGVVEAAKGVWDILAGLFTADFDRVGEGFKKFGKGLIDNITSPFRAAQEIAKQAEGMGLKVGMAYAKGDAEGRAAFKANKEQEAIAASGVDQRSKPGVDAKNIVSPGQDVGASALTSTAPKASGTSKADGVTVGGDAKGSGRTITMDINITNHISLPKDANMGVRELAEKVTAALVNKLNDAQYAMG